MLRCMHSPSNVGTPCNKIQTWVDFSSFICRYLSLSKLVTRPGASGAFLRLLLDQAMSFFQPHEYIARILLWEYFSIGTFYFTSWLLLLTVNPLPYVVSFCSHFYWNFPIDIDDTWGKAIGSDPKATTGIAVCWTFFCFLYSIRLIMEDVSSIFKASKL